MHDKKTKSEKHADAAALQTILMAVQIRRYGASASPSMAGRATLDATARRQRAIICPVLPPQTQWSLILA